MEEFSIIFIIFIPIALICFAVGYALKYSYTKKLKRCTAESNGTVIDLTSHESDDETVYAPVVEYDVYGIKTRNEFKYATSPSPYKIGDEVKILFNPDDVNEFLIVGDNSNKMLTLIMFLLSTSIFAILIIFLIIILILA